MYQLPQFGAFLSQRHYLPLFLTYLMSFFIIGCSGDNSKQKFDETPVENTVDVKDSEANISVNQVGYLTDGNKRAIVPAVSTGKFVIKRVDDHSVRFEGTLSEPVSWALSDDGFVTYADFSDFTEQGEFYLEVPGLSPSWPFTVGEHVYHEPHRAALKSFYFNRAGIALTEKYAGRWQRPAGHPDSQVSVHASATTPALDALAVLSSEKGWYDAGDYGKYIVNSGIATYTLLAAYEHFPTYYQTVNVNIPESGNGTADLLDEIRWNLDWMASMQRHDGAVFHKLTTLAWAGIEMPHEDRAERYVIGVSTAATLDFAATLAMASRVYSHLEPEQARQWLQQAQNAWQWAVQNPSVQYTQPEDVQSGEYGDEQFADEFFWAAAELFIATEDDGYLNYITNSDLSIGVPGWANVETLGLISLLHRGAGKLPAPVMTKLQDELISLADDISEQMKSTPYNVPMQNADFVWGSNSVLLNKAFVLLNAYGLTGSAKYKQGVYDSISYVFGMNPTGYSFVTGYGHLTPMAPHHRISASDGIEAPVPGMLVGGPHAGWQDNCQYPSSKPANSYLDDWCSFSTNEIAINWNAPLVYVLGAVNAMSQ
ncbi:glycoside hydrolase family 9 protein [Aestuariibacter sp. A3R04]|uniref:glycoside hydrolase family 9 protein n=1 Tax=Aestuariibacter sp. A3R04 TaxID=2841571 RepID=UPI001C0982CE|nr:glycoside hydrolase family 9 protein [Aestuariibacter sp. A3R04]MBU3021334.1 glycoside hydrolase family 9 protein [Aestuariibacter sp. A3R04]